MPRVSGFLALVAFALVLGAGASWFRRAQAVSLPEDRTGFVALMATAAATGVVALALGAGWFAGTLAGLAVFGGSLFLLLVSISAQKGGSGAFQVGSPVPDFAAPDENGEEFRLSSLSGKPLLLKFFRGHW